MYACNYRLVIEMPVQRCCTFYFSVISHFKITYHNLVPSPASPVVWVCGAHFPAIFVPLRHGAVKRVVRVTNIDLV
jgi:hypothetical protein